MLRPDARTLLKADLTLALDARFSIAAACRNLPEATSVVTAHAPARLPGDVLACAGAENCPFVCLDGTLIPSTPCSIPGSSQMINAAALFPLNLQRPTQQRPEDLSSRCNHAGKRGKGGPGSEENALRVVWGDITRSATRTWKLDRVLTLVLMRPPDPNTHEIRVLRETTARIDSESVSKFLPAHGAGRICGMDAPIEVNEPGTHETSRSTVGQDRAAPLEGLGPRHDHPCWEWEHGRDLEQSIGDLRRVALP